MNWALIAVSKSVVVTLAGARRSAQGTWIREQENFDV